MKRIFTLFLACLALAVEAATVKVGYTKSEGDEFWAYDCSPAIRVFLAHQ